MSMDRLPPELLEPILPLLDYADACNFACVNQRTNQLARKQFIWFIHGLDNAVAFLDLLLGIDASNNPTSFLATSVRHLNLSTAESSGGFAIQNPAAMEERLAVRTFELILDLCRQVKSLRIVFLQDSVAQEHLMRSISPLKNVTHLVLNRKRIKLISFALAAPCMANLVHLRANVDLSAAPSLFALSKCRVKELVLSIGGPNDSSYLQLANIFFTDACEVVDLHINKSYGTGPISLFAIATGLFKLSPTAISKIYIAGHVDGQTLPLCVQSPPPLLPNSPSALWSLTGGGNTGQSPVSVTQMGPWSELEAMGAVDLIESVQGETVWMRRGPEMTDEEHRRLLSDADRFGKQIEWF